MKLQREDGMKVYHMSDTLRLGNALLLDYKGNWALAEPFTQALSRGEDCFWGCYFVAKYASAALEKFKLKDMPTDQVKWATEGAFEYVRQREFPDCCSRLKGNYFFEDVDACRELFEQDWGRADAEERARIRLFEVELDDPLPRRTDMRLFDEAYDLMWEENLPSVLDRARCYFSGGASEQSVWEIVSDRPAVACRDLTALLHG